jgi:NAD(P)-dependent dehydrogenase (short-subunit alcohol dehydrogenase family)
MASGPLDGKAVLISGASSGAGCAAAAAFAAAGADVALLARGERGLARCAARVREAGRRAVVVPADVTDRAAVQAAVDRAVAELGGIDVLVPCAAITVYGAFDEVAAEDFDRVVEVTLLGTVNLVRAALPELERTGGSIVALGSLMSRLPLPTLSSYGAAKHGVRGFLGSLRVELAARRSPVTVSLLHPAAVNTPVWEAMPSATGRLPRRPPEAYAPEQVAQALVELAIHPRREFLLGAEAKLLDRLVRYAPGAGDVVLRFIYRYYRSGRRPAPSGAQGLRVPVGEGATRDGIAITRPSLTFAVGRRLRRLRGWTAPR